MPVVDGFYSSSVATLPSPTGGGSSSVAVQPYANGVGTSQNIDPDVDLEVILVSATPDPAIIGNTLVITGMNFDLIENLYIGGVKVDWMYVSLTEINVSLVAPVEGLQEIYAEYR